MYRSDSGQRHQLDVMREGLALTGLDTGLASGATYRRIKLPGNDCEWIDSSARQLAVASVQFDDAEPTAFRLIAEGWAVRRWLVPGEPDPVRLEITAAKGDDQLRLAIGPGSLGIYVNTRPCPAEPENLAGFEDGVEVDRFP